MVGYQDIGPEGWAVQKGYIPTCEYDNTVGPGSWSEGVDFVVLDEESIAYRLTGDHRDDEDWQVGGAEDFAAFVIADAEEWLDRWQEEAQDPELMSF